MKRTSQIKVILALILALILVFTLYYAARHGYPADQLQPVGKLAAPSSAHPFGTDNLSRDYAARVLIAGKNSVITAILVVGIGATLGFCLALAQIANRRLATILYGLSDLLMALPALLMALLATAIYGNSLWQLAIALGLAFAPSFARVLGAAILQIRSKQYFRRLELLGAGKIQLIFRELLPLLAAPFFAALSIGLVNALLAEASLSFLGLGLPASMPSWGSLLKEAQGQIFSTARLALIPGTAICLTGLVFYLLSSAIADFLNLSNSPQAKDKVVHRPLKPRDVKPNPDAIISVHNLSLQLGKEGPLLLEDFNLELNKGECLGLLGPSGSGKSLASLTIAGLAPEICHYPSGKIRILGKETMAKDLKSRRKFLGNSISLIFQDPQTAFNPLKRVGTQIGKSLKLNQKELSAAEIKQLVLAELDACGLDAEKVYRAYPHQLSGGMRQRALIALALVSRPQVVIADEATSSLDLILENEILNLLKRRQAEDGLSLIFISHDLRAILEISDRVARLENGTLREVERSELLEELTELRRNTPLPEIKRSPALNCPCNFAVKLENLWLHYADEKAQIDALREINLEIAKTEILGLLGVSGSGKTSLLRILTGELMPSSGEVHYCLDSGENLIIDSETSLNKRQRRELGLQVVFQDPYSSLHPKHNLLENLYSSLKAIGVFNSLGKNSSRELAIEILHRVGISKELYQRYPSELSGGQRQRVAIAAACITRPKILLADEAVSSLDPKTKKEILKLLLELKAELGFTAVFISHEPEDLVQIADRIALISAGTLVELSNTRDFFRGPESELGQELLKIAAKDVPLIPPDA